MQPRYLTSHRPHSSSHPGQLWQWKSVEWPQCLGQPLLVAERTASPACLCQTPVDAHKDLKINQRLLITQDVVYQDALASRLGPAEKKRTSDLLCFQEVPVFHKSQGDVDLCILRVISWRRDLKNKTSFTRYQSWCSTLVRHTEYLKWKSQKVSKRAH